jgi:hypothetical protein
MAPHYSLVAWGVLRRGHATSVPRASGFVLVAKCLPRSVDSPNHKLSRIRNEKRPTRKVVRLHIESGPGFYPSYQ